MNYRHFAKTTNNHGIFFMEFMERKNPPHLLQVLQLIVFLCYSLWKKTSVQNVFL